MRKFFMVWRQGGTDLSGTYESRERAIAEARRLRKINPRCLYVILDAVGFLGPESTVPKIPDEEVPF